MKPATTLVCVAFTAFVLGCAAPPLRPSISKPMNNTDANTHLQTLWQTLEKPSGTSVAPVMWNMAVTPVLPASWPPSANTLWVRYAYAQGMDMRLADGVYITTPWAKVELRQHGVEATVVQLGTKLVENGIQGMVPLKQEEFAVLHNSEAPQTTALGLSTLPDPANKNVAAMKTYYKAWLQANGRIARMVEADHGVFFAWASE